MDFAFLSLEEPPATLYQYTSLQALTSIVQSKRVWASSIRFLNDQSESKWLRQHVVSILNRRSREIEEMQQIISAIESRPLESHFVASFTEKPDDLSQWRAYCPPGLGVNVGFSTRCLEQQWIADHRSQNHSFRSAFLQRVRYYSISDEGDLEAFIERLLNSEVKKNAGEGNAFSVSPVGTSLNVTSVAAEPGDREQSRESATIAIITAWLSILSPFIKHAAFKDEAEWRKLISRDYRLMPGQLFRQGKSTLIPYVEILLDVKTENASRVPQDTYFVNEVIVGPTPQPELTIEALQALFTSEGQPEVRVRASSIPYRSW